MQIPEMVVGFLNRNLGKTYCDSCIEQECDLASRGDAARITETLELFPEFRRTRGQCTQCGRVGSVVTGAA